MQCMHFAVLPAGLMFSLHWKGGRDSSIKLLKFSIMGQSNLLLS